MTNTYFVTRTDTGTDKTIASCVLLQAAGQLELRTVGYKPVASGNEITAEGLRNSDMLALQRNSIVVADYAVINPYTFAKPTSPHTVSADEERPTQVSMMSAGLRLLRKQADWVLVEDAGGLLMLLPPTLSFSDWVEAEQLPMILVVGAEPDYINHVISVAQTVQQAGLTLAGWVANGIQPPGKRHAKYMATLKRAPAAPLLGEVPWLTGDPE